MAGGGGAVEKKMFVTKSCLGKKNQNHFKKLQSNNQPMHIRVVYRLLERVLRVF